MDEQNSDGQQPGIWESWSSSANEPGQPGESDEDAGIAQPPDPAQQAYTRPIQDPQAPDAPYGYGQPGGYPPAGYGQQAGYPQQGEQGQPGGYDPGYGQQQPGGGFGAAPPGGYSSPGGYVRPGGYQAYGAPGGPGYGAPGGYGPPPRRRGLTTAITYIAVAAMAATAGALVVAFAAGNNSQSSAGSSPPGFSQPNTGLGGGGTGLGNGAGSQGGADISNGTLNKIRNAVEPGLVVITSNLKYDGAGAAAAATGMIISKSGMVLTNNHVINGTTGLMATVVGTGRHYPAKWIGYDKGSDIAVIQLEGATALTTVPLGNSSAIKVGDDVVGMGNAGGTGNITSVAGTITGLNQTITASDDGSGASAERLTGMIQTNANIIPGDSGGPLASTDGRVIGMDTAASTASIANDQQDVGFAIPINKALTIAHQIISGHGSSSVKVGTSGFVGVLVPSGKNGKQSTAANPNTQLQQQQQQSAQNFSQGAIAPDQCVASDANPGVPARIAPVSSGTLVLGALCQTPAAAAGMIPGDVITRVNSQPVSSPSTLMDILQGIPGGKSITLTWVTPTDQTVTRTITLTSAPPQ